MNNVIVPLDIRALSVGTGDAALKTIDFAGATADFTRIGGEPDTPNTGENVVRRLDEQAVECLGEGVHLHWQLPDVLTHGNYSCRLSSDDVAALPVDLQKALQPVLGRSYPNEEALAAALAAALDGLPGAVERAGPLLKGARRGIVFPPVLNRWLVTRSMSVAGAAPLYKQWVVESDRVMAAEEYGPYHAATGRFSIAIPRDDLKRPYCYLGRAFDLKDWAEDPAALRLENLTAVGFAGPAFASYYPDCMSVFGFHDTLSDAPRDSDVTLSYHVVGWQSDADKDPCARVVPENWVLSQAPALPARTLCSGVVREVPWNSGKDCVGPPADLSDVKLAVGNTTTEVLAALIAASWEGPETGVEWLLDAFQLGLLNGTAASPAKIEDALHQKGFGSTGGGSLWVVKKKGSKDLEDAADSSETLPEKLARLLDHLNGAQQDLDRASFELRSRREQLFLDWYRYIYALYPADPSQQDDQLQTRAEALLETELDAIDAGTGALEAAVAAALSAAQAELPVDYELKSAAAARFWQPNEPVLLLSGEAIRPVRRDGDGGPVACRLSSELPTAGGPAPRTPRTVPSAADVDRLLAEACSLEPSAPDVLGCRRWSAPWLPLFLSWTAAYRPVARAADGNYPEGYLRDSFALDADHIDLQPTASAVVARDHETYRGDIPLSTRSSFNLADQVAKHAAAYPDDDADGELSRLADFVKDLPLLSQSLSGLNLALITRRQTLQLPPSDPFSDDPSGNVTKTRVRDAVTGSIAAAPISDKEGIVGFNPIRAGFLELSRLDVIDAFGQRSTLAAPVVIRSGPLQAKSSASVYLPPRFTQPCRLQLRWLSASGELEMNDHPSTSPICGWLLPNHLDNSLAVYAPGGTPLGSLGLEGGPKPAWRRAPDGTPGAPGDPATDLANRADVPATLLAFIVETQAKPKAYLADLLKAVETACLNILPGSDPAHLGTLIGRPLALADVSVGLELQGLPAVDMRWEAFTSDSRDAVTRIGRAPPVYDHSKRRQAAFTAVKVPVRLGDLSQADDGLVGYFTGDGAFYSAAAEPGGCNGVVPPSSTQIQLDAASAPRRITLLLDPRACVHATTGVLPVKSVAIPADQYADALRSLNVTFAVNPVLAGTDGLRLPLPQENGYQWSWVQVPRRDEAKETVLKEGVLDDRAFSSPGPQKLKEGWLKLWTK